MVASEQTAHAGTGQTGYDISSPQCNGTAIGARPANQGSFDILGVNAGVVYSPNPCLAAQYSWATGPPAPAGVSFYANTADPGSQSRHWPVGQASPRRCPIERHYRPGTQVFADCSYDYGWNAAANSFAAASNATPSGVPASAQWWLDVESANSWTSDHIANTADIQGGIDYLKSRVAYAGIYTDPASWASITGSTRQFSGYPFWAPGGTKATAAATCANPAASVTGGHIRFVQYQSGGFDNDYDCG
ncbi:MAG TPA: hypothetical protein VG476_06820 [Acidimicrobiales bacterium]|nr:hypothetical protein [Acidimicrobiales bacterium]